MEAAAHPDSMPDNGTPGDEKSTYKNLTFLDLFLRKSQADDSRLVKTSRNRPGQAAN